MTAGKNLARLGFLLLACGIAGCANREGAPAVEVAANQTQEAEQAESVVSPNASTAGSLLLARTASLQQAESMPVPQREPSLESAPEPIIEPAPEPAYTQEELDMLATTIYCEAGADYIADETRQMVGEVVLNRVASEFFPDTIAEVLTAPYQYGRFHWTGVVLPVRASYDCEAHAVQRAYDVAEALLSGSVDRLLPEDACFQSEHVQGSEILAYVDGIYFCR